MSVDDWDFKRIYRDLIMLCITGMLGWTALQMTEMKVTLAESAVRQEQCLAGVADHENRLNEHENRIHGLEVDVSVLKSSAEKK